MDIFNNDNAFQSIKVALNGLIKRQEIIGQNIVNVDTPNYIAQEVDFESVLARSMDSKNRIKMDRTNTGHQPIGGGNLSSAMRINARAAGVAREDGNTVNIDEELGQMAETGIRYQALTTLTNSKFNLLKNIASRR